MHQLKEHFIISLSFPLSQYSIVKYGVYQSLCFALFHSPNLMKCKFPLLSSVLDRLLHFSCRKYF